MNSDWADEVASKQCAMGSGRGMCQVCGASTDEIAAALREERNQWISALEGSTGVDAEIVRLVRHAIEQNKGVSTSIERERCAKLMDHFYYLELEGRGPNPADVVRGDK